MNPLCVKIMELNQELQKLNDGGAVPYISMTLILGMLQEMAGSTLDAEESELPLNKDERLHVFTVILAITKAIVYKTTHDEKDGHVIWVPKLECEIKEMPV